MMSIVSHDYDEVRYARLSIDWFICIETIMPERFMGSLMK